MRVLNDIAQLLQALLFEVLDELGRVRLRFGAKTLTNPQTRGYAIEYLDPAATGTLEGGIIFGDDNAGTVEDRRTAIYAGRDGDKRAVVLASSSDAAGVAQDQAQLYVVDDATSRSAGLTITRVDSITRLEIGMLLDDPVSGQLAYLIGSKNWTTLVDTLSIGGWDELDIGATAFKYAGQSWTSYSPRIRQNAAAVFIPTVNVDCAYFRLGPICFARGALNVAPAGAGVAGQIVNIELPLTLVGGGSGRCGMIQIQDVSAGLRYNLDAEVTNTIAPLGSVCGTGDTTGFNAWGGLPAIALAPGDGIVWNLMYRCSG